MPLTAKDLRLKQINARFKMLTPRRRWEPSVSAVLTGLLAVGMVGSLLMLPHTQFADFVMTPMSFGDRARHLFACPNCSAARLVGAAPARRGEPGYWNDHDADQDGVACEPIPNWRQ